LVWPGQEYYVDQGNVKDSREKKIKQARKDDSIEGGRQLKTVDDKGEKRAGILLRGQKVKWSGSRKNEKSGNPCDLARETGKMGGNKLSNKGRLRKKRGRVRGWWENEVLPGQITWETPGQEKNKGARQKTRNSQTDLKKVGEEKQTINRPHVEKNGLQDKELEVKNSAQAKKPRSSGGLKPPRQKEKKKLEWRES